MTVGTAAGMPIVADAVGQNREYLEHMKSGFLVEGGHPEAFAEGVVTLLRDKRLRQTLGQEAQRRAYRRFNWGSW